MGAKKNIPRKKVAEAYAKCGGALGMTAQSLGIGRTTLWHMMQRDGKLVEMMNDYHQTRLDRIENNVYRAAEGIPNMVMEDVYDANGNLVGQMEVMRGWIEPPDHRCAKLVLEAKAKDRGYGKLDIDLGAQEGTQILITNTVVRRGQVGPNKQVSLDAPSATSEASQ